MGCPRSFSISGGMGAALLTKPELIHDVCNAYPLKMLSFLFLFSFSFCEELLQFVFDSSPCLLSKPDSDNIKEELGDTSNM